MPPPLEGRDPTLVLPLGRLPVEEELGGRLPKLVLPLGRLPEEDVEGRLP